MNEQKNSYMVIDAPKEWISGQDPTSTLQAPYKLPTSTPAILSLINILVKNSEK